MSSPRPASLVLLFAIAVGAAACGEAPAASFDPTGACVADGSAPGAYPDLEVLIPATFEGQPPESLDSGRNCTAENLGSLAEAGIKEIRFAGGTWSFGSRRAAALVVFTASGLTADAIALFYAASAQAANRTVVTATSAQTYGGRPGRRIDTETGDRFQSVLVWPSSMVDRVNVVISTDLPDAKLLAAVDAIEAASGP